MDVYVAVVSHHGKPEEVHLFTTEDEARSFTLALSRGEDWDNLTGHADEHDDHVHESHWLEDWGDDDGCGVVMGPAATP